MTEQGKPDDDMTGRDPLARPKPMDGGAPDADGVEPKAGEPTAAEPTGLGRATPAPDEGDQPRYVDDRVSKWWVGIIIAVFAVIFAWAVLLGGGGLLSDVFEGAEPTVAPAPSLATNPSPQASLTATPELEPTADASTEPTAEPTLEATALASSSPAS